MAIIVLAFASAQLTAAEVKQTIPTEQRVILKGVWTPPAAEMDKALDAVDAFLKKPVGATQWQIGEIRQIRANIAKYRVQLVGDVRNGKKVLFCNFIRSPDKGEVDSFAHWKRSLVQVSDGGFWYWSICIDTATGKCFEFNSNGYG